MAKPHWALSDIHQILTDTGYKIIVWTFQPCHLWFRWTTIEPEEHIIPRILRGVPLMSDKRFCFVAYKDNEQEEDGDTYVHTFLKEPWPVCETRFFYFHGTISSESSPSTSCIFKKHRPQPPITKTFYPDESPEETSVDGYARHYESAGATWATLVAAAGTRSWDYINELRLIQIQCAGTQDKYWQINRGILLFDTSSIPPEATIISAILSFWGYHKMDDYPWNPSVYVR